MLVITRKVGTELIIGDDIHVTVLSVRGNSIRLGIAAPRSTPVLRSEVRQRKETAVSPTIQRQRRVGRSERTQTYVSASMDRAAV